MAVTTRFLAEGWRVVVPWIVDAEHDAARERLGGYLGATGQLELVRADLFNDAEVAAAVRLAADRQDAPLRAAVNLVGGFAVGGRVHDTPVEDFEEQLRLNLRPTYLTSHHALPHLLADGGAIVCVSSMAAKRPFPGAAGYVTAKAAVLAFVDALAIEYKKDGVRVNAVLPSMIDTPGNRAAQPAADHSTWVPPERIAEVIHFLCDEGADAITGAHVDVPGQL
jgi:NAD(P)-dependent dehydrogenase (short-subunit alcohol dehydrogenase family)